MPFRIFLSIGFNHEIFNYIVLTHILIPWNSIELLTKITFYPRLNKHCVGSMTFRNIYAVVLIHQIWIKTIKLKYNYKTIGEKPNADSEFQTLHWCKHYLHILIIFVERCNQGICDTYLIQPELSNKPYALLVLLQQRQGHSVLNLLLWMEATRFTMSLTRLLLSFRAQIKIWYHLRRSTNWTV